MKREVYNHVNKKRFNYGYIYRRHRGYRKALRQCRRNLQRYGVGFDDSETWDLHAVIIKYLVNHNFPLPHKEFVLCYYHTGGQEGYLDRYYPDLNYTKLHYVQEANRILDPLMADVLENIKHYNEEQRQKLIDFVLPRIDRLKNITIGYSPAICNTFEDWILLLGSMLEELKQNKLNLFLQYFQYLWW